jgi:hypothetical protein
MKNTRDSQEVIHHVAEKVILRMSATYSRVPKAEKKAAHGNH